MSVKYVFLVQRERHKGVLECANSESCVTLGRLQQQVECVPDETNSTLACGLQNMHCSAAQHNSAF